MPALIVAAAATLHTAGNTDIQTAQRCRARARASRGLPRPKFFGVGLLGASMLAAGVLPLATSYAISEALGFRKASTSISGAGKIFLGMFTALIVIGAGIALIPNVPIFPLLVGVQVLNGVPLPVILVFILLLVNNQKLMGDLKNSKLYNFLGWGTFVMITIAVRDARRPAS